MRIENLVGGRINTDGSARFFSDSIDLAVWRAVATRAGGETVSPP